MKLLCDDSEWSLNEVRTDYSRSDETFVFTLDQGYR